MPKRTLNCELCKTSFTTHRNARYCGNKCRIAAQSTVLNKQRIRKDIICKNCNISFSVHNYLNQKFCSKECSINYQKNNSKPYKDSDRHKINLHCQYCKKEYRVWNYRKSSKFCSKECHYLSHHDEFHCKHCNNIYETAKWTDTGYCSSKCKNKSNTKRQSEFERYVFNYLDATITDLDVKSNTCILIDNNKLFPDILIGNKVIIECFGDYWHCNPLFYNESYFHTKMRVYAHEVWKKDSERIELLKSLGYKIIVLWETNFKTNLNLNDLKQQIYDLYKD